MRKRKKRLYVNWIKNSYLLLKSRLSQSEKRTLMHLVTLDQKNEVYELSNYDSCKTLIKIGYKLEMKMDYIHRTNPSDSDEMNELKYWNQCIGKVIRKYSM